MSQTAPHIPVLLHEVMAGLAPRAGGLYVDGTFGAGGYSQSLLEALPTTQVLAIDRDPAAAPRADQLAARFPNRLTFMAGRFGDMAHLLAGYGGDDGKVDGITLDVGVSSMQIDDAHRGFSFRFDGPLDMRMEQNGPSAADLVNSLPEEELANLIYRYGEERLSRRIAKVIEEERRTLGPITTTGRLASLVRRVVKAARGPAKEGLDPATRTFQALRIAVNDEIGELERGLLAAEGLLKPEGRLAVVTFHSLEDRVVKTFLHQRADSASASRRLPGEPVPTAPSFRLLGRKAIIASDAEVRLNPRARSAHLRIAIRTDAPAWPAPPTAWGEAA